MKHRKVVELLPWYANETLKERERRSVEAHLEKCEVCGRELEQVRALQAALLPVERETPDTSPALLQRTLARIEAHEEARAREGQRPAELFGGLRGLLDRLWVPIPAVARAALVAQFALLLVLGGALLAGRKDRPDLATAGGTTASGSAEARTRLSVAFQPDAPERAVRETLRSVGAELVSGPSREGFYTVAVDIPPGRTEELETLLGEIRRRTDVIRFAEPLP